MQSNRQSPKSRPKPTTPPPSKVMLDSIFSVQCVGWDASSARAISQEELKKRELELIKSGAFNQYVPTLDDMRAMQNYRRPAHVPPGMADWYAVGDDLT